MPVDSKYTPLEKTGPVYRGSLLDYQAINNSLLEEYLSAIDQEKCRQTHFFNGRFENTYIDEKDIPSIKPVREMARFYTMQILDEDPAQLKTGFWFNAMAPGNDTSLHTHEEYNEKLSAVYYIRTAPDCGDLIIHDQALKLHIPPREGNILLFRPEVPHAVAVNNSGILRLSVAFNFGL